MFIFCVLLTLVTYPIIFAGSLIIGIIVCFISDSYNPSPPNPFVSPNTVYKFYRESFTAWKTGLINWYKEESK
jgi:multisubunit Na+/H+ antiporter MnhB subunit